MIKSIVLPLKSISVTILILISLQFNLFAQTNLITDKILHYTQAISTANYYNNKGELEEACKYYKLANKINPIHYWDLMFVKYFLKKKFDKELYTICVREELIQNGFSNSIADTALSNNLSKKELLKIKRQIGKYQFMYITQTNKKIENDLREIISLDQFARTSNISYLYNCDTCRYYRRKLMHYIDSAFTIKSIQQIFNENSNLTYRSFGSSYSSFTVMLRHIVNNKSQDTLENKYHEEFLKMLLSKFIITPENFANISDYCFNYNYDKNNQKVPYKSYGEFSMINGKLEIDNPEETDKRRMEIGLLPLYQAKPRSNLPANYLQWYDNQKK